MTGFRYLDEGDNVRPAWPLKNGHPAHVLTRSERSRGGLTRALRASERRLSREARGSVRLEQAAKRLGWLLRSDDLDEAMWADETIKRYIGEPPK